MKEQHITMESILLYDTSQAVNQWLHRNDVSQGPMSDAQGTSLLFAMSDAINKCIDKHDIHLKGNFTAPINTSSIFIMSAWTSADKWIKCIGSDVNRYQHFLDRVCDICDDLRHAIKDLHKEYGLSIEGEVIYRKHTNHWLRRAELKGVIKA